MTYAEWIAANIEGDGRGRCAEMTLLMQEAFPELTRVRGHYCAWSGLRRPHWWLVTPTGQIVDPTGGQFRDLGPGEYEEWTGPIPTGRCPNCGGYAYDHQTTCSATCAEEFRLYLQGSVK